MPKELRSFIAVAGARARWRKSPVSTPMHTLHPLYDEYLRKRDEHERLYGELLVMWGEP